MKRPADQSTTNSYPLVNDIYDTVPLPFTREIPLRPAQPLIPNSLRMIQSLVATASSFPNPIHKFTIPEPDSTWISNSLLRRKLPSGATDGADTSAITTDGARKQSRLNNSQAQPLGPNPEVSDNEELLMTQDDINQILAESRAKNPRTCPSISTPPPNNDQFLTEDKIVHHLLNLALSLSTALLGSIDILKFVRNRRLIATKSSLGSIRWFKETCNRILSGVLFWCPKAKRPSARALRRLWRRKV
ncbi:hypothetical protein PtA15_12A448 [Puccinia triticina]|uniref:Uncharacterized protein n=1 Tax=Puccinia triticina TaxID=208348 RepID=A0ABY7D0R5_9BASI|nr:uncharacterized protein PtA15_12A448 [Puccinia triticina]WAQ90459.1 hypothetical protein PtA15_12A448 [Puccinia triticina]